MKTVVSCSSNFVFNVYISCMCNLACLIRFLHNSYKMFHCSPDSYKFDVACDITAVHGSYKLLNYLSFILHKFTKDLYMNWLSCVYYLQLSDETFHKTVKFIYIFSVWGDDSRVCVKPNTNISHIFVFSAHTNTRLQTTSERRRQQIYY